MSDTDAIIVGGGHNGLTCAAYLGMAGLHVRVFERRGVVGGACVTEEFHGGFRNSTAAFTVSLLQPKVIRDLKLYEHGLRVVERRVQNFKQFYRKRCHSFPKRKSHAGRIRAATEEREKRSSG